MLAATAGCHKPGTVANAQDSSHAVAIVDLDQVALDLGWHDQLLKEVDAVGQSFDKQLLQTQQKYDATINKAKADFVGASQTPLTPEQQRKLDGMFAISQRIMNQLRAEASSKQSQYRGEWVMHYREALIPIVSSIAKSRDVSVVFSATDALLYRDASADLTAAVTSAAKTNPPQVTAVAPPTLPSAPALVLPTGPTSQP